LLLPQPQMSSSPSSYNTNTIKSSPSASTEPTFQQQSAPTHHGPNTNTLTLTPSSAGGSEFRFSFSPEEDPALRRPYEMGPAGTPGPTHHHQHHQHPSTPVYAEYTNEGTPRQQSAYVHTHTHARPSSSYVPPPLTTTGSFVNGTGSALPSPSYGPGSHTHLHHHQQHAQLSTSSPYATSTRSHHQHHEGPSLYMSGPYDASGAYAGGGDAMASLASPAVPGTPSEEHVSVYGVKGGHPSSGYHTQGAEGHGHGLGTTSWTTPQPQSQPQPQPTNESYWNGSYTYQ
jgi:hypothetical protein